MPTTSSGRRLLRQDAGDSLIEILVALAVLSIGVTALITALGVMVRTTGNNRSEAHAESALASTAEFAKTMPLTAADFSSCHPTPLTITTQVILPAPFTATIGVGSTAPGAPSCAALMVLPVDVQGDGFHLTVKVVRRP